MAEPNPKRVLAADRRQIIAEMVRDNGSIRVVELAEKFGVTESTIRRDLASLAGLGVLRRAHGGAVSSPVRSESVFSKRQQQNSLEKLAIGQKAAELVTDGSTIVIDSGTTTACMAGALQDRKDLVVVTNAITLASELVDNPNVSVVLTGGMLRRNTLGAVGDLAVGSLQEIHVDQAFLAIHSVSLARGLTYPSFEEVAVKRAMIDAASEVVLLADHTKFGRDSLVRVAPITDVDHLVVSQGIDPGYVASISELGVEVTIVDPAETIVIPDDARELQRDRGNSFAEEEQW